MVIGFLSSLGLGWGMGHDPGSFWTRVLGLGLDKYFSALYFKKRVESNASKAISRSKKVEHRTYTLSIIHHPSHSLPSEYDREKDDPDIAKIKKVQSFFRGWLCRRRWKQIVEQYINSPHADSMRKRNW